MAPYTLYLVCLTALSGGALLQGWVLDGRPQKKLLELRWSHRGEIRVEERVSGADGVPHRVLLEDGRVRGSETPDGDPGRGWERATLAALEGEGQGPGAVLYLGGGSGTFARLLSRGFPESTITVVEGSEELVQMARTHLKSFVGWKAVDLHVGEPWSVVSKLAGLFPLILIDSEFLPSLGRLPWLPDSAFPHLARLSGPGGTVVLGGMGSIGPPGETPLEAFLGKAREAFERVVLYQGEGEEFLVFSGPEAPIWSPALPGFGVSRQRED